MIDLIEVNKFQELKEKLQVTENQFGIHNFLLAVLKDEAIEIDGESFKADFFQEEFLEGLKIYKALDTSSIPEAQFEAYSNVLVQLAFKMGGFIQLMANTAMEKGMFLSEIEDAYKVHDTIREKIQEFIDLLKSKDDIKAVANVSAAKTQITTSLQNLLQKEDIGWDMLQFAESYVNAGHTEFAIQIYQGILNDFESESVKLSSGLFPEINHVDTRPKTEIEIYNSAKAAFTKLSNEAIPEATHITPEAAKNLVAAVKQAEQELRQEKESNGFLSKLKRFFKK
jgi:hypothetical protein